MSTFETIDSQTYIPFDIYLPEELRKNEFFTAMRILINYTQNELPDFYNEKYAMLEQAYKDISFKYKDIFELSEDALKLKLAEDGFEFILDILNLTIDKLRMFVLYLPLFKALKGTDVGFRELLKYITSNYTITSYVEDPINVELFTFEIAFTAVINEGFNATIIPKLAKFSRNYVYPVLKRVTINVLFRTLAPAVYSRPIIQKRIALECVDELKNS